MDARYVLERVDYRANELPQRILEFQDWIAARIDDIPVESRRNAAILAVADVCWMEEEVDCAVRIIYQRPETNAEREARIEQEQIEAARKKLKEIREEVLDNMGLLNWRTNKRAAKRMEALLDRLVNQREENENQQDAQPGGSLSTDKSS